MSIPPRYPLTQKNKGTSVATYNTSDFRKGLKVQIDGEPYMVIESNFRKPGKGNAI
ncbi:MAG: hypothetical protein P8K78_09915, partial [Pirellulales bacterium]|nr:hypothetical protein [Pirellulales bacterium]